MNPSTHLHVLLLYLLGSGFQFFKYSVLPQETQATRNTNSTFLRLSDRKERVRNWPFNANSVRATYFCEEWGGAVRYSVTQKGQNLTFQENLAEEWTGGNGALRKETGVMILISLGGWRGEK